MKKHQKLLAGMSAVVAMTAAGVVTNEEHVLADTAKTPTNQSTNNALSQAEKNVETQQQAVQSAQAADDQAVASQKDAQGAVNQASAAVITAQQAVDHADAAVTSAATAKSNAQAKQTEAQQKYDAASQAMAKQSQAQADLNQARSAQSAVANENANGQLDQAVSDAQTDVNAKSDAVSQAQASAAQANTALNQAQDALNHAGSVAGNVTQADIDKAQTDADQAQIAVKDAQNKKSTADNQLSESQAAVETANKNVNDAQAKHNDAQTKLTEAQQALSNAQSSTDDTQHAQKNVADILWIPDNFSTVMKGAFDEARGTGHTLTQEQQDMLKQLYTKNVNAFTDHMNEVMSDADYDTTYDLSGRTYWVTDQQGHGSIAQAELEVFAADVLNAFRSKLGMPLFKVNTALDQISNFNENNNDEYADNHLVTPPVQNISELTHYGQSNAESNYGVQFGYPIMGEPNVYSMDQLKYNLFLQLMQAAFQDVNSAGEQGDHAATLLGMSADNTNSSDKDNQYIQIELDPASSDNIKRVSTQINTKALTDDSVNKIKDFDYTSKIDPATNSGSSVDLGQLQQAVTDAENDVKATNDQLTQAQAQLAAAKKAQSSANDAVQQAETDLQNKQAALATAQDKLQQLQAEYAQQQQAADHDATVAKLQQAVKDAQTTADQANNALAAAKQALADAQTKLTNAQSKLNDWKSRKAAADKKVTDLQTALDHANPAALENAKKALADAEAKLADAQQALTDAQSHAADAHQVLTAAQAKLTTALKALSDAKNHQTDTATVLSQAQAALTQAQKELAAQQAIHGSAQPQPSTSDTPSDKPVQKANDHKADGVITNDAQPQLAKEVTLLTGSGNHQTVVAIPTLPTNSTANPDVSWGASSVNSAHTVSRTSLRNGQLPQTGTAKNQYMIVAGALLAGLSMFGLVPRKRRGY